MKGKKADKSLNMIFGLFILLIITLVVLGIFFKTARQAPSKVESVQQGYFSEAQKDQAIGECQSLCDKANNIDTAIEFCRKIQKIDWDGNGVIDGDLNGAVYGRYTFCEFKIPCFVLYDCSSKQYSPPQCIALLRDSGVDADLGAEQGNCNPAPEWRETV